MMRSFLYVLPALIVAIILIALNWVGYDGADDLSYAIAAQNWLIHFPYVGDNHWALRHTIVLPVALSLKLLGPSEFALALPNVLYFLGTILVNYYFVRRFISPSLAPIVAVFIAATPEFVVQSTYINIDIAELFYVSLSFWIFVAGREIPQRKGLFVWAGIVAALAFMTRETSLALIIFYGLCFLVYPGVPRSWYFLMGLGFFLVIGLEVVYLGTLTGDILYRYRIDDTRDIIDRAREVARVASEGGTLDNEGNLSLSVWLDPIFALFASQKYGLLFYLGIPAAVWACVARTLPIAQQVTKLLGGLALTWILFVALSFPVLPLVPRYFTTAAWASVILVAYFCYRAGMRVWTYGAVAALAGVNCLSFYLENTDPRFAERALVQYLSGHPGIVHTDPDTARRIGLLLEFAHLSDRVTSAPAQSGDVFAYSPLNLEICRMGRCNFDPTLYQRQANWIPIERFAPQPRGLGTALRAIKADRIIPAQIMTKIDMPVPGISIYRIP